MRLSSLRTGAFPAYHVLFQNLMAILLATIFGIWVILALVFVLALCVAARKPMPQLETSESTYNPVEGRVARKSSGALCLK
jgi:hypothetical protein